MNRVNFLQSTIKSILAQLPAILLLATLLATLPAEAASVPFGFADISLEAKKLAANKYAEPNKNLPPSLATLDYDQYRDIRYKPAHNVWRPEKLPFDLAFFHRGHFFQDVVQVYEIGPNGPHEIAFDPENFDYGSNHVDKKQLAGAGFAGMRVHYAVNTPDYRDEVLTFLGSSYFRALGQGQRYGASARGLAIDTGLNSGEEFPLFRRLWIERPGRDAKSLTLYGLLDSPRSCGAYRFVLRPGKETVVDVDAQIFLRNRVGTLGIAPLTSMFFFGANQHPGNDDYRPEVHDSDGLSLHSGSGEWLWRPLINPKQLLISSFADKDPVGFGLMQRQRSAEQYQDVEAHYEMRPSVWVEPVGHWGAGRVELVQIPAPDETHDNIVAYWVPAQMPAQQPYKFSYRLHWQRADPVVPPQSWVIQTRRGNGFQLHPDDRIGFLVDFQGPAIAGLPPDARLQAVVTVDGNARLLESNTYRNDINGGMRVNLQMHRIDASKPVEIRAFLRNGNNTVSETWSYLLPPG
jgi:glucans biosynthesis protein